MYHKAGQQLPEAHCQGNSEGAEQLRDEYVEADSQSHTA